MNQPIAFIGLGAMGSAIARNLLHAKIPLYVFNRTQEKAAELVNEGAQLLQSPKEAFEKAKVVMTMLADDKALEDVTLGSKGLIETIKPDCIHISMSTISPDTSRRLANLHLKRGAYYLAAPVFGRPDAAAAAKLRIGLSGASFAKKQVEPILKLVGQSLDDFGEDPGNANVIKLAGNFLLLSAIEAMGEAFHLVKQNGIDQEKALSFYSQSLFASPIYQNYGKIIVTEKFEPAGFKLKLGLKDINLIEKTAETSHSHMPLANLLHELLEKGILKGNEDLDWSAITLSNF